MTMASGNDFGPPITPYGQTRKPRTTIYIVLLLVAFVALVTGCILLLMEINRHGGFGTVRGTVWRVIPAEVDDLIPPGRGPMFV
jgi:quinol-cytochrome oxidoreductase complex cytochrome b subunit